MVDIRALVPWRERSQVPATGEDFFEPFRNFRREVDRMLDTLFDGFGPSGASRGVSPWWSFTPAIDVSETDKELLVTAELPGVSEKDIDVTLAGDILTIKGEKKSEHERHNGEYAYAERSYGSFSRSIRLPFEAKDEDIEARYDKGVLTVRVPKPAELQKEVRHIEVKAA